LNTDKRSVLQVPLGYKHFHPNNLATAQNKTAQFQLMTDHTQT